MHIPLYKVLSDKEDVNAVARVINRGTGWAIGPEVEEFEKELSKFVGTEYCVTLNSGTSALHAILAAYKIGMGDEVIVPSFTFIATVNCTLFVNAAPTFADIERDTYGLDYRKVKQKLNKRTRAIIPIHYGGTPCDIFRLKNLAEDNNVLLIEDAAESIGSTFKNKKIGSIGDSSIISFCGNKIMTTGEGGAVLTNSKEIHHKLNLIRSHGRNEIQNYFASSESPDYVELGYNWRISSITAAIGLSQLKKINLLIDLRRQNSKRLSDKLSKFTWIRTPQDSSDRFNVYQMYTIELVSSELRENLRKYLSGRGITCKIYFDPVHKSKYYAETLGVKELLPVTEDVSGKVLSLPMFPTLSKEEIEYMVETIAEFAELYNL